MISDLEYNYDTDQWNVSVWYHLWKCWCHLRKCWCHLRWCLIFCWDWFWLQIIKNKTCCKQYFVFSRKNNGSIHNKFLYKNIKLDHVTSGGSIIFFFFSDGGKWGQYIFQGGKVLKKKFWPLCTGKILFRFHSCFVSEGQKKCREQMPPCPRKCLHSIVLQHKVESCLCLYSKGKINKLTQISRGPVSVWKITLNA